MKLVSWVATAPLILAPAEGFTRALKAIVMCLIPLNICYTKLFEGFHSKGSRSTNSLFLGF